MDKTNFPRAHPEQNIEHKQEYQSKSIQKNKKLNAKKQIPECLQDCMNRGVTCKDTKKGQHTGKNEWIQRNMFKQSCHTREKPKRHTGKTEKHKSGFPASRKRSHWAKLN